MKIEYFEAEYTVCVIGDDPRTPEWRIVKIPFYDERYTYFAVSKDRQLLISTDINEISKQTGYTIEP